MSYIVELVTKFPTNKRSNLKNLIFDPFLQKNVMLPLIKITKFDQILFCLNQSKKGMAR